MNNRPEGSKNCQNLRENLRDVPSFNSFETHPNDMGDFLEQMPEVDIEVAINRTTFLLTLDVETARKLDDIAYAKQITPTALIQDWLREKVLEYA